MPRRFFSVPSSSVGDAIANGGGNQDFARLRYAENPRYDGPRSL
jgi:hypothetical protein